MAQNGTYLTPRQQRAIEALLISRSATEAAAAAGIGRRTLARWLTEPAFVAALRAAEGELITAASRALLSLAEKAIRALEAILDDPAAGHSAKLRAADIALARALDLRQAHDFEQRLAALEAAAAQKGGQDAGGTVAPGAPAGRTIDYRRALHDDRATRSAGGV